MCARRRGLRGDWSSRDSCSPANRQIQRHGSGVLRARANNHAGRIVCQAAARQPGGASRPVRRPPGMGLVVGQGHPLPPQHEPRRLFEAVGQAREGHHVAGQVDEAGYPSSIWKEAATA